MQLEEVRMTFFCHDEPHDTFTFLKVPFCTPFLDMTFKSLETSVKNLVPSSGEVVDCI